MSADWWQNFANNFAADLAPLLSLFGEQPTKQFLSETLTFVDIAIFSIAPIGVLTALVSAIRVGGDPSLRAFIGRAQEGGAYAEAELCSSISRDVCELYTTGGIARVFGRPKILEIVHDPSKDREPDIASIYTFKEYSNLEQQTGWTEKKAGPESERTEKYFADHPNLSLNIGIKKLARPWFYLAAALGFFLQGAVLVFAALTTYVYPDTFKRDDTQIAVPAFPFTFAGTILLCTGVGLCATVVESSTKERTFKRNKDSKCRLHWIQPGGQVIGDQVFDSFAYSETSDNLLEEYTTSWKSDVQTTKTPKDEKPTNPLKHDGNQITKKTLLVWAAIITTCVGFVLQFLGIRTLHSSVSVAQFVVMLAMSIVRALLRTQRLKKSDNQMGDSYSLYEGHELDWLAIKLACRENDRDNKRWIWEAVRPFEGFSYKAIDLSQNTPKSSITDGPSTNPGPGPDLEKAFLTRARLARLTGALSPNYTSIAYSPWDLTMIASRELASSLAKAIESTMALLYSNCTIEPAWKRTRKISWSIPCGKDAVGQESKSQTDAAKLGYVSFTLNLQTGSTGTSWKTDRSELEAALGLWLWSIRLKDRRDGITEKNLLCSRIVLFKGCLTQDALLLVDGLMPEESNLRLWLSHHGIMLRYTVLNLPPGLLPSGTIVAPLEEYPENYSSDLAPEESGSEETKPKQRRLFSCHLLPKSIVPETKTCIFEVSTESPVELMCAQEIFSAFLMSLSTILQQIGGEISAIRGPRRLCLENRTVSEMVRSFAASGIGSENDALSCIVPVLVAQKKLIHTMAIPELRNTAEAHRRRNEWSDAEQVLLSALDLSFRDDHNRKDYPTYTKSQNLCLLTLCELYRRALHGDRNSRLFGLRGFRSICERYAFRCFPEEVFDYFDVAFALCTHSQEDPAIQKLSEELKAEVEKGKISTNRCRQPWSNLLFWHDESFPRALHQKDLAATLYLLKDKVLSFCRRPPAIALAAQNGWVRVLKGLLELGANPSEIDTDGLNYLHYASQKISDPEVFLQLVGNEDYLLNRVDRRGRTPLHLAAEANHEEITGILIDQFSLDPHQWDLSTKSSFECACYGYHAKTLAFLVTWMVQRRDPSSSNFMWDTLMQLAIQIATSDNQVFFEDLLKHLNSDGTGSLNENMGKVSDGLRRAYDTLSQQFSKEKCFEFDFLQSTFHDHFCHDRTFSSTAALSCKARINNIPMPQCTANPRRIRPLDNAGRTYLHYAIKGGDEARVQHLFNIKQIARDIDVEDRAGRTPLAYAFGSGNLALTSLLHERGAGLHNLPLKCSAIAAHFSHGYHLFFQDIDLKIREMAIHSLNGNIAAELSPEIAIGRVFTPLAVAGGYGDCRKVYLYYVSEENYICESVSDGNIWYDGTLNHRKIEVEPLSGLAALQTDAGVLRVLYQDTLGDLQEIRSTDENEWGSPNRIRQVPRGTAFAVLTTPEGVTRVIFQSNDGLEEIYENHTDWKDGVLVKMTPPGEKNGAKPFSIAVSGQPSRKVFWLDDRSHIHETTLTDNGRWEHSTDVDLVTIEPPCWKIQDGRPDPIQSRLAVIGSKPKLLYQNKDGSFFEMEKQGSSWRRGMMAIPAFDS